MNLDIFALIPRIHPLITSLIIIHFGLFLAALIDLIKRKQTNGPKWLWVIVIIAVSVIGPILYFFIGRQNEQNNAQSF
ncbi:MAG: hypothetical protein BGO78_05605 [Chloroflexi bacterium 44-23]|nr:MAG: hypothetical protein BGO78_05605 [Chloroflexi bacterium 44-23]